MPCPSCKYSFRVMEDEQGMHECPRCGLPPNAKRCGDCGRWFVPEHRRVLFCLDCDRQYDPDTADE